MNSEREYYEKEGYEEFLHIINMARQYIGNGVDLKQCYARRKRLEKEFNRYQIINKFLLFGEICVDSVYYMSFLIHVMKQANVNTITLEEYERIVQANSKILYDKHYKKYMIELVKICDHLLGRHGDITRAQRKQLMAREKALWAEMCPEAINCNSQEMTK